MRYQYVYYGVLLFLSNINYCISNTENTKLMHHEKALHEKSALNTSSTSIAHKKNAVDSTSTNNNNPPNTLRDYLNQFDKKNFYMNASVIYAIITDGGLNNTPFTEVINAAGNNTNYTPNVNPNLGFQIQLGYKLDPTADHTLTATYRNIETSGTTTINAETGGFLVNDFTQFGNALSVNEGFHLMKGPATAIGKITYGYQHLSLTGRRPHADEGGTPIKFYIDLGLRFIHLNKNFDGQYNGLVETTTANVFINAQDNVNYSANYYGIGPQLSYQASLTLTKRIKLKGSGTGGALAGFYNSSLSESATAAAPVTVFGLLPARSNYSDNETHPIQAWTPAIFEAQFSVLFDLLNPGQKNSLSIEGGVFLETILPLSTNDSINQNLGQQLDKLNNNLNMSGLFITLNAKLD